MDTSRVRAGCERKFHNGRIPRLRAGPQYTQIIKDLLIGKQEKPPNFGKRPNILRSLTQVRSNQSGTSPTSSTMDKVGEGFGL